MINLEKLRLYPFKTNEIFIPGNLQNEIPYNIIYLPENVTFYSAYRKLRIKRQFVKLATVAPSKLPRIIANASAMSHFKAVKLIPVLSFNAKLKNMFVDTSHFFELLEEKYPNLTYRQPMLANRAFAYLMSIKKLYPDRKNVLLYHVDLNNDIPKDLLKKKLYLLARLLKSELEFDYILGAFTSNGTTRYSAFKIPDKQVQYSKLLTLAKDIKSIKKSDTEKKNEIDAHVNNTTDLIAAELDTGKSSAREQFLNSNVKSSVSEYLNTIDSDKRDTILHKQTPDPIISKGLAIKSIIYNVTRDMEKTNTVFDQIAPEDYTRILKAVKVELSPQILEGYTFKNKSTDSVYKNIPVHKVNDGNNPSRVLNKRKVDFEQSFQNDLVRSFKLLSDKSSKYPLQLVKVKKNTLPIDPGDLEPSKYVNYALTLKDEKGEEHNIDVTIPEIQSDGTFLINGRKKFLIYQILIDPIFFLKPGLGQLQTMYAPCQVHWRKTIHKSYFETRIAGYKLPIVALLGYHLGFAETMKLFRIKYDQGVEKAESPDNPGQAVSFKLKNGEWLNVYPEKEIYKWTFVNSLKEITNPQLDTVEGLTTQFFRESIVKHVGHRNCLFKIDKVLKNIMEPISLQILKSKMLPTTFAGCLLYMCQELAKGRVDDRNDIDKQRIRSSEVFNFLIQKLVIASYDEYVSNREHGNKEAKYYCDTSQIIKDIQNSQLMRDMENINPIEELSVLTRTTPVGPGGIPDKHAVTKESRNLHASYFGNLEPMDTPENESVGMINQLTVDAAVANVRGSFGKFSEEGIASSVLSTTSAMIPYVDSCDGNRVMMGSSQARQAIPISGPEQPICQSGFETIQASMLTDSYIKKSPFDGKVIKITSNVIYVQNREGTKIERLPLDTKVLKSAQGMSSLNYFTPTIKVGQSVKEGQIVAEGKHMIDGVISSGTNLLTALGGWKGYGFEDGYIISDAVAEKKFTSTSYEEITVYLRTTDTLREIVDEGRVTRNGEPLIMKTSKDIEELLDLDEDEIVEGQGIVKPSPGGKIIAIEIYPNISINKFPKLIPQYEKFKARYEEQHGVFPKKFLMNEGGRKAPFSGIKIVFKIERYDECTVGDKITNNHGGKGVIALVEKESNMPITPWGEKVELIFNSLAIINRMNPSTLYELYTGLISKFLAKKMVAYGLTKRVQATRLIAQVYTALDRTDNQELSKSVIKAYTSLSDKQYGEYLSKLVSRNYVLPIILPPFKCPTKEMIFEALKLVGAKSKYIVTMPEYGKSLTPMALGYLYYKKLEQQAAYKLSGRSIGRYEEGTGQPVAGKKRGGGQKLGELDVWSIIGHGADNLLRELMGPLSDDRATKDEMLFEILQKGSTTYREPKKSPAKDLLSVYTQGMMLDAEL